MRLVMIPGRFAVARLDPGAAIPEWAAAPTCFLARTPGEFSVVCEEQRVPPGIRAERGWRGLRVAGNLSFGETGVLASLAAPLAEAGISIFAVSTFDTDYLFVKAEALDRARMCLEQAGHEFLPRDGFSPGF